MVKNELQTHLLRQACFNQIGITLWERRANHTYFLLVLEKEEGSLLKEERAMLEKMSVALRWPRKDTKLIALTRQAERATTLLRHWIMVYNPKKILLFGSITEAFQAILEEADLEWLLLPALEEIMQQPQSKKNAWKRMQPFILPK